MKDLVRLTCRIMVGAAVYVVILILAARLPTAAGLMLTYPALNGLGFLFSDDERAHAIAKTMFWMPIVNGTLCSAYVLLFIVLIRRMPPTVLAWGLLVAMVGLWFAWVSRRTVHLGIDRRHQLTCAIGATIVGTMLAAVTVLVVSRFEPAPQQASLAAHVDGMDWRMNWIAAVIVGSRLKIALFALALACFAVAIQYLRISDAARGILSGLPIVTFGGLLAVATDTGVGADAPVKIFLGMTSGVWLGPAVAMWFIYAVAGWLGSRRTRRTPAADAMARFGVLALGWLVSFAVIVIVALALQPPWRTAAVSFIASPLARPADRSFPEIRACLRCSGPTTG
jgi:hypothetical protein